MSSLLDRTRRLNRLIQNTASYSVDFGELSQALAEAVSSQVFIIAKNGRILGQSMALAPEEGAETGALPREAGDELLRFFETTANIAPKGVLARAAAEELGAVGEVWLTLSPVYAGGERIATLVLTRPNDGLVDDDIIIIEYAGTVVGIELLRSRSEQLEEEARKRSAVQMALNTLSFSEQEAVEHIFDELAGDEGLLVASKIADRVGITRSVIVNALRKFESAGVIESRSLGMKGTYIRVLNDKLFEELDKLRAR
ncbi:MAG: GTP-sensing pleiotropic transcriptional regulator CodY [Clostridia bacterium]|nr:GTP-sensing pleiotropic transcriptional regulator CodY [Clostridia bacterium]